MVKRKKVIVTICLHCQISVFSSPLKEQCLLFAHVSIHIGVKDNERDYIRIRRIGYRKVISFTSNLLDGKCYEKIKYLYRKKQFSNEKSIAFVFDWSIPSDYVVDQWKLKKDGTMEKKE